MDQNLKIELGKQGICHRSPIPPIEVTQGRNFPARFRRPVAGQ